MHTYMVGNVLNVVSIPHSLGFMKWVKRCLLSGFSLWPKRKRRRRSLTYDGDKRTFTVTKTSLGCHATLAYCDRRGPTALLKRKGSYLGERPKRTQVMEGLLSGLKRVDVFLFGGKINRRPSVTLSSDRWLAHRVGDHASAVRFFVDLTRRPSMKSASKSWHGGRLCSVALSQDKWCHHDGP